MGKESLRDVRDILHCHMVALLIVWLALFAPAMCEYHGLMIHFGGTGMDHTQMAGMMSSPPRSGLQVHQMTSSATMVMSLLVVASPGWLLIQAHSVTGRVERDGAKHLRQLALPIPDQPPRQR